MESQTLQVDYIIANFGKYYIATMSCIVDLEIFVL